MDETVKKTKEFREDGQLWPAVWILVGPAAGNLEHGWIKQQAKVQWTGLAMRWEYSYVHLLTGKKSERRLRMESLCST